jgi:hypothetical protein
VRLDILLVEDLADRALRQTGEASMPLQRSMLASVAGQKPCRPKFVRITQFLCLPARQRHQPCLGLRGDRGFLAGTRAIVENGHRAFSHSPLNAALDRLMMQSEPAPHCKNRRILSIGQQYPRPLDPARRLRSRMRNRPQLRRIHISERQLDRPPLPCPCNPSS